MYIKDDDRMPFEIISNQYEPMKNTIGDLNSTLLKSESYNNSGKKFRYSSNQTEMMT